MARFVPEVSVIIPLYNAEKFIAECLESLLAQTFTNFEVIVVDDCSTDSSCAIVENYAEKFGGRLTLSHMETNTGSGALPRSKGLALSRGEYVFIMDNDDLLTPTALEELYTLAKDYDADIVHCEKYFVTDENLCEVQVKSEEPEKFFVDRPTLETENLAERVQLLLDGKYRVPPWTKLVRRSLIIEHDIKFPPLCISDDDVWTYALFFYAKKILRVPNAIYIYRLTKNSISRVAKTPQQLMSFWINPILFGLQILEKLLVKHEFFKQNPQDLYRILEMFLSRIMFSVLETSLSLPPFAVYETIKQKFGDKLGENFVLISLLCTAINKLQRINLINEENFQQVIAEKNERIAQLEAAIKRLKS